MIERLSHRYIARTHTLTLYLTQLLHTFDVRLTYTICLLFFLFLVFFSFFLFSSLLLFLFTFPMFLFQCVWRNYANRKFRLSYSSLLIFLSIAFFVYSLDVHASRFQLLRKKAFLFFLQSTVSITPHKVLLTNGAAMPNRVFTHSIWPKATSIYSNNSQQNEFMLNFIFKLFKFVLTKTTTHGRE